jgi:hypothetical protein
MSATASRGDACVLQRETAFGTRSRCRSPLWVGCGFAATPRSGILAGELSGGSRGTEQSTRLQSGAQSCAVVPLGQRRGQRSAAQGDHAGGVDAVAVNWSPRACRSVMVAGWSGWARSQFFIVCWNRSTLPQVVAWLGWRSSAPRAGVAARLRGRCARPCRRPGGW